MIEESPYNKRAPCIHIYTHIHGQTRTHIHTHEHTHINTHSTSTHNLFAIMQLWGHLVKVFTLAVHTWTIVSVQFNIYAIHDNFMHEMSCWETAVEKKHLYYSDSMKFVTYINGLLVYTIHTYKHTHIQQTHTYTYAHTVYIRILYHCIEVNDNRRQIWQMTINSPNQFLFWLWNITSKHFSSNVYS